MTIVDTSAMVSDQPRTSISYHMCDESADVIVLHWTSVRLLISHVEVLNQNSVRFLIPHVLDLTYDSIFIHMQWELFALPDEYPVRAQKHDTKSCGQFIRSYYLNLSKEAPVDTEEMRLESREGFKEHR